MLTGGSWLLGEGLRTTVRNLGISQSLLGNTAVAASVEAEEAPETPEVTIAPTPSSSQPSSHSADHHEQSRG